MGKRVALEAASAATPAEVVLESNGGGGTTAVSVLPKAPPVAAVRLTDPAPMPPGRPASMTLLYVWIALFGFVGTQLAWTLRPFFGSPHEKFQIFRPIEGTFYADLFRTIGHLFGG